LQDGGKLRIPSVIRLNRGGLIVSGSPCVTQRVKEAQMDDEIKSKFDDFDRQISSADKRFDDIGKRFDDVKWYITGALLYSQ
jgi:hypothetical protein